MSQAVGPSDIRKNIHINSKTQFKFGHKNKDAQIQHKMNAKQGSISNE